MHCPPSQPQQRFRFCCCKRKSFERVESAAIASYVGAIAAFLLLFEIFHFFERMNRRKGAVIVGSKDIVFF